MDISVAGPSIVSDLKRHAEHMRVRYAREREDRDRDRSDHRLHANDRIDHRRRHERQSNKQHSQSLDSKNAPQSAKGRDSPHFTEFFDLSHLIRKKIDGPIHEKDRKDMPIAQNMGLDHAAQKIAAMESQIQKAMDRMALYVRQIEAAIRRGDTATAERLARQAMSAAATNRAMVKDSSFTYRNSPTDSVARGISRLKNAGKQLDSYVQHISKLMGKSKKPQTPEPSAADFHFARKRVVIA